MKKKIISFVLVLVSSLVISLPCFAASLNFTDVLRSQGIFVYFNDRETLNYSRSVYDNGLVMEAYTNSPGYDKYNSVTYYWQFLKASDIKADDILQFTFTGELTLINDRNLKDYTVNLYFTEDSAAGWNPIKIGEVKLKNSLDVDNTHYFSFTSDVQHVFESGLSSDAQYVLFFSVSLAYTQGRGFDSAICISDLEITNYFLGSSSDPSSPQYQNPSGSFGGFNDYEQQESEIVGGLSDGFTQFEDLTDESGFTTALNAFSTGLTAVSSGVSYLVGDSILKQILMLSLLVGSFAFFLGVIPSLIDRYSFKLSKEHSSLLRTERARSQVRAERARAARRKKGG